MLTVQIVVVGPTGTDYNIEINNSKPVENLCALVEIYTDIDQKLHVYQFGHKKFSYKDDKSKPLSDYGL